MLSNEPLWLTTDDVIEINEAEVAVTHEPHLVLNYGLLESACARPINKWHYSDVRDVVILGASLAVGIAKNHAFRQGNKRTGQTAGLTFIEANGYEWTYDDDEELGEALVRVVMGEITEEAYADFLRPFVVRRI